MGKSTPEDGFLAGKAFPFTEARIDKARQAVADGKVDVDAQGRASWRDSSTTGLHLRVGKGGSAIFSCLSKVDGKTTRYAVGDADVVSLAEAREAVGRLRYDKTAAAALAPRAAEAPVSDPKDAGPKVGAVVVDLLEAHGAGRWLPGSRSKTPTDRTMKFYADLRRATLTRYEPMSLVAFAAVLPEAYAALTARAPYQANRFLQLVRNLYGYASDVGSWAGANPATITDKARRLTRSPEEVRTRFLSDDEFARLVKSMQEEPAPWAGLFMASAFTAQRMAACCRMRWDDVALTSEPAWRVPTEDMKGRKGGHTVTLNPAMVSLLKARRKLVAQDEELVFPSPQGGIIPNDSYKNAWSRIIKRAKLWHADKARRPRPHDLRRTAGARMTAAGVPLSTVTKALGNAASSAAMVARTYAQVSDEALKDAFSKTTSMGTKRKR
jgi:integrase